MAPIQIVTYLVNGTNKISITRIGRPYARGWTQAYKDAVARLTKGLNATSTPIPKPEPYTNGKGQGAHLIYTWDATSILASGVPICVVAVESTNSKPI